MIPFSPQPRSRPTYFLYVFMQAVKRTLLKNIAIFLRLIMIFLELEIV